MSVKLDDFQKFMKTRDAVALADVNDDPEPLSEIVESAAL